MVTPNSAPILIPVYDATDPIWGQLSRAIYLAPVGAALPETWVDSSMDLKVDILWSDVSNASDIVSALALQGSIGTNDLTIQVTPGGTEGNALVILYQDTSGDGYYTTGEPIKWSWLIWNVDYSPIPEFGASSSTALDKAAGRWMDRNLGAITNTYGANTVYGYLYQWGRPHPLNRPVYNTNTGENFYIRNGNTSSNATAPMGVDANTPTVTVETWINNPMTLYYNGTDYSGLTTINNSLWNDGVKTVYDPCPKGWRVPASSNWNTGDFGAFSNNGKNSPNQGNYYPVSGYRNYYNANNYQYVSSEAYYSTSTIDPPYNHILLFYSSTVIINPSSPHAMGLPLRCIAIP
jgi:hypothetical protein